MTYKKVIVSVEQLDSSEPPRNGFIPTLATWLSGWDAVRIDCAWKQAVEHEFDSVQIQLEYGFLARVSAEVALHSNCVEMYGNSCQIWVVIYADGTLRFRAQSSCEKTFESARYELDDVLGLNDGFIRVESAYNE